MLTIDCKDVVSVKNDLLVYVADQVAAIPTLKNRQFTLSSFDDDEIIDITAVISAIKEFLDSIGEGENFAVISNNNVINITSISGKIIENTASKSEHELFSCTHCGYVTQYQVELNVHMRIHYI
ncbi:C2H2-type zinc finger protein [archaeon]|nr:C2H2-type zinc finger protein [archaeon]